jgi:hypothetical protein
MAAFGNEMARRKEVVSRWDVKSFFRSTASTALHAVFRPEKKFPLHGHDKLANLTNI